MKVASTATRKIFVLENLNEQPIKRWSTSEIVELVTESDHPHEISDRKLIASYNLKKSSEKPTIVAPGAPKEFYEWKGGDLSGCFNEQQKVQDPSLDAMFIAVSVMEPRFKVSYFEKPLGKLYIIPQGLKVGTPFLFEKLLCQKSSVFSS